MATTAPAAAPSLLDQKLKGSRPGKAGIVLFVLAIAMGVIYVAARLAHDLSFVHQTSVFPYFLLGVALVIALGFEFVNGFHDTANAVATVIYTHSLTPSTAVVWSGVWNFLGVLTSSGAVAYTIVSLLPVELVLKASKGSGFSMILALLLAAILWNLGTWWRGLPVSSSHTMIGSILGVGLANQLINGHTSFNGVDWSAVFKVFKALVFSPFIGFAAAALLFFLFKAMLRDPRLYESPKGTAPPPWPIRALLILTCTGVSFAHGSNDGQKGMGLIMLILVGTVPTAYALNHAVDTGQVQAFVTASQHVVEAIGHYEPDGDVRAPSGSGPELERFISSNKLKPATMPALDAVVAQIRDEARSFGTPANVPSNMQANIRNQMYLASETLRLLPAFGPKLTPEDAGIFAGYRRELDASTKYIPSWVKVAVALALGLGTMVGWKRIVVTVGEKIGKTHLTYAQGASAELVAMCTILAADRFGLPVSTTHVLSSGVAGTMAANGSGLQRSTVRNIIMAWFFTLPAAALLSGLLFFLFHLVTR